MRVQIFILRKNKVIVTFASQQTVVAKQIGLIGSLKVFFTKVLTIKVEKNLFNLKFEEKKNNPGSSDKEIIIHKGKKMQG